MITHYLARDPSPSYEDIYTRKQSHLWWTGALQYNEKGSIKKSLWSRMKLVGRIDKEERAGDRRGVASIEFDSIGVCLLVVMLMEMSKYMILTVFQEIHSARPRGSGHFKKCSY
jgi:hypothetical protein